MKIIDALLGEHGVFYAQFDHIEAMLARESSRDAIRGLAALLNAMLAPHAHMEDELLFGPAMEAGAPRTPLFVMHEDHEVIERALEEAASAADPVTARERLLDAIRAARDHFAREEHVAFDLAARALGEERLSVAAEEWADRRNVFLA